MARILEIQKRANEYIANLSDNIIKVLEKNSETMVNFNKNQMMSSTDANDKGLIHAMTGSPYLSKAYAKRTKKSKPDLFLRGDFQSAMFMIVPTEKEYIITSDDEKVQWLPGNYGKIFGVSPKNQQKAQKINDGDLINDFLKKVFK